MTLHHFSLLLEFLHVASYSIGSREQATIAAEEVVVPLHWQPRESFEINSFLPLSQHLPILGLTVACTVQVCGGVPSLPATSVTGKPEQGKRTDRPYLKSDQMLLFRLTVTLNYSSVCKESPLSHSSDTRGCRSAIVLTGKCSDSLARAGSMDELK